MMFGPDDTTFTSLEMHSISELDLIPQRESDICSSHTTSKDSLSTYDSLQTRLRSNTAQLQELRQALRQEDTCKINMRCEPCKMQIADTDEISLKSDNFRPNPLPESSKFHQIGLRPRDLPVNSSGRSEQILTDRYQSTTEQILNDRHIHIHVHHYNECNGGARNVDSGMFQPWLSVNMPLQMGGQSVFPNPSGSDIQTSTNFGSSNFEQRQMESDRLPSARSVSSRGDQTKLSDARDKLQSRTRSRLSSHKIVSTKVKRYSPIVSPALSFRKRQLQSKISDKSPSVLEPDINNNMKNNSAASVINRNIPGGSSDRLVSEDVPRNSLPPSVRSSNSAAQFTHFSLQKELDLSSVCIGMETKDSSSPFQVDTELRHKANSTPFDTSLLDSDVTVISSGKQSSQKTISDPVSEKPQFTNHGRISKASRGYNSQLSSRYVQSDTNSSLGISSHLSKSTSSKQNSSQLDNDKRVTSIQTSQDNSTILHKSNSDVRMETRLLDGNSSLRDTHITSMEDPIMLYAKSKQAKTQGQFCKKKELMSGVSKSVRNPIHTNTLVSELISSNLTASSRQKGKINNKDSTGTSTHKNITHDERLKERITHINKRRPSIQRRKSSSSRDPFKASLRTRKKSVSRGWNKDQILLELCDVLSTELIDALSNAHHDKLYELAAVCKEVKKMKKKKAQLHGQVEESNKKVMSLINTMQKLAVTS